jgi:hypothetical protein
MEHAEQELKNEQVELDPQLNPIILPTTLYEFFLNNGRTGIEAMTVWLHLVYTARRQSTNQVWANNIYLQNGLQLGERKIRTLKAWLHKHGLIEYVDQARDSRGTFKEQEKRYIRVKASSQYLQSTETAFTARAVTAYADMTDKCLNEQEKCLKEQHQTENHGVDFAPLEKGKVEKVVDDLETFGVSDTIASKQAIQKAFDNGLSMDDATAFFSHCLEKTQAKKGIQNIQGYALTLFSNAAELSAFKEATKPEEPIKYLNDYDPSYFLGRIKATFNEKTNFLGFLGERGIDKADKETLSNLWNEFLTTERLTPSYVYISLYWMNHGGSMEEKKDFYEYAKQNGKNFRVTPDFGIADAKPYLDELYSEFVLFRQTQDLAV